MLQLTKTFSRAIIVINFPSRDNINTRVLLLLLKT